MRAASDRGDADEETSTEWRIRKGSSSWRGDCVRTLPGADHDRGGQGQLALRWQSFRERALAATLTVGCSDVEEEGIYCGTLLSPSLTWTGSRHDDCHQDAANDTGEPHVTDLLAVRPMIFPSKYYRVSGATDREFFGFSSR
jgi:hypothetical protein